MRKVVVDMQNRLFSDAVARTLSDFSSEFNVFQCEHPDNTTGFCSLIHPDVLIMEVTSYTPWKLSERLRIRQEIKNKIPGCKVVLVVDENTEKELADCVRQAKKDGLIDNFIYGSVSATYLSAVIDTL